MAICPYCKDSIPEDEVIYCPACEAAHHFECWEENSATCSVFGCESQTVGSLLGCPFCEEVYPPERRFCMTCNSPLMRSDEYLAFLNRHEWVAFPPSETLEPLLAAGYLRNNGIVARVTRKVPISMFGFARKTTLLVAEEQEELADQLLLELSQRFTNCPVCGHVLYIDEEECSFCAETQQQRS